MSGKTNKNTPSGQPIPQPVSQTATQPFLPGVPNWAPYTLIAFTALLYGRALQNGITFMDDDYYILNNPFIRDLSWHGIKAVFTSFYNYNYHPLTTIVYLFEYSLFKLDPMPYHLVNVLLHLLNVWLVFRLTWRLSGKKVTALVVSILFAIHPMHVESVAWISETKDVLYTAFYLLSCLWYLQYTGSGYRAKYYSTTLLFFILSLLSKPAAVTLPVLLIAIDIYKGRRINAGALWEKLPFVLLSLLFAMITIRSQQAGGALHDLSTAYSPVNRIFLFTSGLSAYLLKLVAPFNLSAIYYFPNATNGTLPWEYYASLPFLLFVIWLIVQRVRNSPMRKEIIFGICFFVITISVMLQILTVGLALIAERYTYVSYIGLFYIAGQWISNNLAGKKRNTVIGLFSLVMILFSIQTWARIGIWKDTETLFTDIQQKNPGNNHNCFLFNSWGDYKYHEGDMQGALQYYNEAIRIYPDYERALYSRGLTCDKLGNLQQAIADYDKAIRLNPLRAPYYNSRGWAKFESGDKKAAIADFNKATDIDRKYTEAYNNRGWVYYQSGDNSAAMADFGKAILLDPAFAKPFYNRAALKAGAGDMKGAIDDYNGILQNHPGDSLAYFDRGIAHLNSKDTGDACADWKKAAELGNMNAKQLMQQFCR